ncbi:MAG: acyl-CoA dehydrogenase family protein [Acidimicrobiales bacterium]
MEDLGSAAAATGGRPAAGASADLAAAANAVRSARVVVRNAASRLAEEGVDNQQVLAYDVAHAAAAMEAAEAGLAYGSNGPLESDLACAFAADAIASLAGVMAGREELWGSGPRPWEEAAPFLRHHRDPARLAELAEMPGPRHLSPDLQLAAETFRRFAQDRIAPAAERVHRENADVPEDVVSGLAEMGAFGLSVPERYGGSATGSGEDQLAMVVATEELSRASLGAGGSLVTRPEIVARAILDGGTEEQRLAWLPRLASGEVMAAVAVTEPDHGSDVANLLTSAAAVDGGFLVSGTKTWCTFAARAELLLVLARTDADRSKGHRGLSLLLVEKPRAPSEGFVLGQGAEGGRLEGRPIDTLGYRGMHSYELSFDRWWVPFDNLVGGQGGLGRGFYMQMAGFESGRLQTVARAVGMMQAAYEAALDYARHRVVFGQPVAAYQLSRVKLGRMAATVQVCRQLAYRVARLMAGGGGGLEASMAKAYVCRAAEWVTREAMQLHGGMGYAEEYPVSRYFVDARVLSIFEGADETLALRVIARRLAGAAG